MLDDNNILQSDATVIAGLLILVTPLSFKRTEVPRTPESSSIGGPIENIVVQTAIDLIRKYSEGMERIETDNRVKNTLSIVTIGGMLPFSVSAILIIFGFQDFAKFVMVAGFVYLVVGVILLIITYRKVVERDSYAPWSGALKRFMKHRKKEKQKTTSS